MRNPILYGDKTFSDCFRSYYQPLCYFASGYVKDSEKAEDVVQDVFVRLLEQPQQFADEEHLKGWLYKSVRNACLDDIKLSEIHARVLEEVQQNATEETADLFHGIVRSEIYARILEAVDELPVACGTIFRMSYMEGLENEEIAARLNLSVNTVKSQKNKAKNQLRELLKDLYPVISGVSFEALMRWLF